MKLTVETDAIFRAQKGETEAFSQIYNATYNALYFLALGLLKNHEDACDAVQDSFTEIIKNFSLKNCDKFSSWMCIIVSNKCKKILRARKSVELDEEAYDLAVNNTPEESGEFIPEQALENKEFLESIRGSINELPFSQRNMVLLHHFAGMSLEEIALTEKIPVGTVKSRLCRAREKIKQSLKKGGLIAVLLLSSSMLCKALELIAGENQLDPQKAAAIFSKALESAGIPVAPATAPTTTTTPTNTGGKTMKTIITKIIISIIAVVTIAGGAVTIITINKNTDDTTLPAVSGSEYTGRTTASTASTTAASRTTTTSSSTTANGRPGATGAATTTSAGSRTTTTTTKATTAPAKQYQLANGTYNLVDSYRQLIYDGKEYRTPIVSAESPSFKTFFTFSDGVLTFNNYKYTTDPVPPRSDIIPPPITGNGVLYYHTSGMWAEVETSGDYVTILQHGTIQKILNPDKFPECYDYNGEFYIPNDVQPRDLADYNDRQIIWGYEDYVIPERNTLYNFSTPYVFIYKKA